MTDLPARATNIPLSLIDVAETLGGAVALKLIAVYGGQEVKFPKAPGPDHPVIKALGEKDGLAVCQFMGGMLVYVPHGRARKTAREDILRLQAAGKDRREIARILGLSQRHVRRQANATPITDPRQTSLFDDNPTERT